MPSIALCLFQPDSHVKGEDEDAHFCLLCKINVFAKNKINMSVSPGKTRFHMKTGCSMHT